jgi:hypothetical protein
MNRFSLRSQPTRLMSGSTTLVNALTAGALGGQSGATRWTLVFLRGRLATRYADSSEEPLPGCHQGTTRGADVQL